MHREKTLTRSELGANDLGALGGSRQGHCQGWDGDLDWEGEQGPHRRQGQNGGQEASLACERSRERA